MKKRAIIMGVAVGLVMFGVIGGTIAAPTITANTGNTVVNIQDLEVALAAEVGENNTIVINETAGMPGETIDLQGYKVVNGDATDTSTEYYDLYARVVIDKQWVTKNSDGKDITDTSLDPKMLHVYAKNNEEKDIELVKYANLENWIVEKATSEQIILYYKEPLKSGESTDAFLTKIVLDSSMDNQYTDKTANITVTVNAVQATVAEKSMLAEWGVIPTFDENGNITAITE